MDKLNLPVRGEEDWFNKLLTSLQLLDGRITNDGFNRNYVLTNGLAKPDGDEKGSLGIDHFHIGNLNIVFGWGNVKADMKQYQPGYIQLPYQAANYRCVMGDAFTWDGDLKFTSADNGRIMVTPQSDVNNTFEIHFIMLWDDE